MAHKFGSSTASDIYDDGMEALDLISAIPGENSVDDARVFYPHHRADGALTVPITKKEAVLKDEKLATLAKYISLLRWVVESGDREWRKLPHFRSVQGGSAQEVLAQMSNSYQLRYRHLCSELVEAAISDRAALQRNDSKQTRDARKQRTIDATATITQDLVARMIKTTATAQDLIAEGNGEEDMDEPVQIFIDVAPVGDRMDRVGDEDDDEDFENDEVGMEEEIEKGDGDENTMVDDGASDIYKGMRAARA